MIEGRIQLDKGFIVDADEPLSRIDIDRAEFDPQWDAHAAGAGRFRSRVVSGGNRITLLAQLDAPRESRRPWGLKITGGTVVLAYGAARSRPLVAQPHLCCGLRIDPDKQRIDVEQGEIGNSGPRARDLRRSRLFRGRTAARPRHRRQPHVGGGDEAAVAVLHQPEGARLGRRPHPQRARSSGS